MPTSKGFTGIAFPFHFSPKGGVATSTTSATDFSHIRESISQILRTQLQERVIEISFGTDSQSFLFEPIDGDNTLLSIAKYNVKKALTTWEPRISLNQVNAYVDPSNNTAIVVDISYTVIQYQATDNLKLSFASAS